MNNYADGWVCITLDHNKHIFEESNIINNYYNNAYYGIIYCEGSPKPTVKIIKCCLIKNNGNNKGYLFWAYQGTMEVRECSIQSGYNIYGAISTSYSNLVAGSECAAITNCGARIIKDVALYNITVKKEIKCSLCNDIQINNFQRLFMNKPFLL
jgi:hypothetical protein